ncbi:hypothetical protein ACH436_12425 [Isoptericola sp. NPDC019693]|uniref:hypothetical protein n=1 Tax=Isoptericola sp. NPDC019693 TaxID=3364009 RepID=UPI0037BC392B
MEKKRASDAEKDPRLVAFGRRVAAARASARLTQAQVTQMLAEQNVTVPATAVAKIETGTRPTSVLELVGLSTVLNASVGELTGEADPSEVDTQRTEFARALWQVQSARADLITAAERYRQVREVMADAGAALALNESLDPEETELVKKRLGRALVGLPQDPVKVLRTAREGGERGQHPEAP